VECRGEMATVLPSMTVGVLKPTRDCESFLRHNTSKLSQRFCYQAWTADFNPRGASAPLPTSKAKALRGLKPAVLAAQVVTKSPGFLCR
jgi:hypothetical protein